MKKELKQEDRDWLVGFTEGEGSFTVSKRGDLQFVITQGYKNLAILHETREMLGIGSVNKQGPRTFRYVVQDKEGIKAIIEILNGQLALEKRKEGFKRFLAAYEAKYGVKIENIESDRKPTTEDAWLSGFTDGEGCFTVGYVKTKNKFQIRYLISQKEDLTSIKAKIGGTLYHNKSTGHDDISFTDMEKSKGDNTKWVASYFREYPLRTTKKNSYYLWSYIRSKILEGKVTPSEYEGLKVLSALVNETGIGPNPLREEGLYQEELE